MKPNKTLPALFTIAALCAPMASQAQDPAALYGNIQKLAQAGEVKKALELSDQMINTFGNKESRVAAQFSYMLPFFIWQKAEVLQSSGDYAAAYPLYKDLAENTAYRNKTMIEAALRNPGKSLDYRPFFSSSLFQMAYCGFKEAVGSAEKPGDPTKFAQCISDFNKYGTLFKAGKVSDAEKKQALGAKVSFFLLQAYLLQDPPNFEKAEQCYQEMAQSDVNLPDDMAIQALETIVGSITKHPEQAGWVSKLIESNRDSYDTGLLRNAKFGDKFLNGAIKVGAVAVQARRNDQAAIAFDAVRSAFELYGLVPESKNIERLLGKQLELIGQSTLASVPDIPLGVTYSPKVQDNILKFYQQLAKDNQQLEGMSILGNSGVVLSMGANRLAKAGYQLLNDRYPKLSAKNQEGTLQSLRNDNLFQLSQLARATGDIAYASTLEKQLESMGVGGSNQNTLLVNKMSRIVAANDWAAVPEAADAVIAAYESDKDNPAYATALFCKVAAAYKLNDFAGVIKEGEALLNSHILKGELIAKYEPQAIYFLIDSYARLGLSDPKNYDQAMKYVDLFIEKHPSTDLSDNPLAVNVYYSGIDTLLKRRGHGVEEEDDKDMEKALGFCQYIADNWPSNALYPTSQLLAGSILINGKDEAAKPAGINSLVKAYKSALALTEGQGKATASNAIFWLISYSPEITMPAESDEDAAKRIQSYSDIFWSDVDAPGDIFCLQVAHLDLKKALESKDDAAFKAASDRILELVARESQYNVANNTANSELEAVFFDYAEKYFTAMQAQGKEMSLDEKIAFLDGIPNINKQDKYTSAILTMAKINAMMDEEATLTDTSAKAQLNDKIAQTFREMTRQYKPADLTNYICVQVGDFLVEYVSAMPDSRESERKLAIQYYDKAINDQILDQYNAATLGKAHALSITDSPEDVKQATALYDQLVASQDYDMMPEALLGLTKIYMRSGDYAKAIEMGQEFLKTRAKTDSRLNMLMLLGEAYSKAGDPTNALATYMNLYNQNRGRIAYSAPACVAMMDVMWKRNNPSTGSRHDGNFKASDRWTAWSTGQDYISWVTKGKIEDKMTPAERDKYRALRSAVEAYSADQTVQAEDKAKRDYAQQVSGQ